MLDLPPCWEEALARAEGAKRVAVIGPADSGKSAFVAALAGRRPQWVIDLDPGQKMIGPPGTVALGRLNPERRTDRFVFLGSTSVGSFKALAAAAADLARRAGRGFVANTSGYVAGPGAALQAMTLSALRPELVVAIAAPPAFDALLAKWPALRLGRSPSARAKPPGLRRSIRQAAFAEALTGASERRLPGPEWEPAEPRSGADGECPVCAVVDSRGEHRAIGILLSRERVLTRFRGAVARVRLGKLWARRHAEGWILIERLLPAWEPR